MAGLGVEVSWAATAFRVCARRSCLAVVPVDGARPAGPDGSTPGDERAARGLRGLVAVPVGGGGAWPGFEIDHSERSSCVAISRAGRRPQAQPAGSSGQASRRPEVWWRRCRAKLVARTASGRAAAHRRNRPDQVGRPRAARKCGGEDVARERGRQEFSVRRRRSRRGRLTNRSRMGRCGPSGSRGRSRRLRRLHRCRGPGRGRRRRRPGRV